MAKSDHSDDVESLYSDANRLTYVEQQLLSLIGELNFGVTRTEADIKTQVRRHGLASRMRAIIRDCKDEVAYHSPLLRGQLGQDEAVSRTRGGPALPPVPPLPPLPSPLFGAKPMMKRSVSASVSDSGHSGYGYGHAGHTNGGYANGYGKQVGQTPKAHIAPLSIDKVVQPLPLGPSFSSSTPAPPFNSSGQYKLTKSNSTGTTATRARMKGKGKMRWKSDKNKPLPPLPPEATPTPSSGGFGVEDKPLPQLIPSIVLRTLAARTTVVSDRARKVLTVVAEVIDEFDRPPEVDRELKQLVEQESLGRVLFCDDEDDKERVDGLDTNTSLRAAKEMREKHLLSRSASRSSAVALPPVKESRPTGRRRRSNPNRAVVLIQSPGHSDDEDKNVGLYSPRNASKDGFQGRTCTGQARSKN